MTPNRELTLPAAVLTGYSVGFGGVSVPFGKFASQQTLPRGNALALS